MDRIGTHRKFQVLKEYEKTISDLIAEKEGDKDRMEVEEVTNNKKIIKRIKFQAEVANAISEKAQAVEDLHNVEAAFADVHRKYERTKQVVEGFKKNEEQLKKCVEEYKEKLKKQDQKYNMLKAHAEEKLEEANREIDKIARSQVKDQQLNLSVSLLDVVRMQKRQSSRQSCRRLK